LNNLIISYSITLSGSETPTEFMKSDTFTNIMYESIRDATNKKLRRVYVTLDILHNDMMINAAVKIVYPQYHSIIESYMHESELTEDYETCMMYHSLLEVIKNTKF